MINGSFVASAGIVDFQSWWSMRSHNTTINFTRWKSHSN